MTGSPASSAWEEMSLDEDALDAVAEGGSIDFDEWAGMVELILQRLDNIVYNDFPMPRVAAGEVPRSFVAPPPPSFRSSQLPEPNSILPSSSNKENTPSVNPQTPPRRPAPVPAAISPASERVPDSQPQSFAGPTNETLPAPLLVLLDSIKSTIKSLFSSKPPHTLQRLIELILRPNQHYNTLPAYLRALDRVVSVTSTADVFSSQTQTISHPQPNGVINGATHSLVFPPDHALGSDESLGGALLTPIPWLSAASLEMDNSAAMDDGDEPSFIGLQAQEEHQQQQPQLQPQSQGPDTVHPIPQQTLSSQPHATLPTTEPEISGGTVTSPPPDTEEIPHARGPPILGVEDMGLQDGKGIEMTLASQENDVSSADQQATVTQEGQQQQTPDQPQGTDSNQDTTTDADADGDGDILLDDIKGEEVTAVASTATTTATATDEQKQSETADDK